MEYINMTQMHKTGVGRQDGISQNPLPNKKHIFNLTRCAIRTTAARTSPHYRGYITKTSTRYSDWTEQPLQPIIHPMLNIIMLILLLAVIATSIGVFFWFTRRLDTIEEELWGDKKREAEKTAKESADKDKSDKSTPEQ
jgi:hypothetical protein